MAEPKYDNLKLVGLHEPDFSVETDGDGHKHRVELPGMYSVGVLVDDQFHAVASFKAGKVLAAKEAAKSSSKAKSSEEE